MENLSTTEILINCKTLINEYTFLLNEAKKNDNIQLINKFTKLINELNIIKIETSIDYYNDKINYYTKLKQDKQNELKKYRKLYN